MNSNFSLTSGPTMMSDKVRASLSHQTIYDTDPLFVEKFLSVERRLADLMGTANDIALMQGEAVLGLEAAARGLTGDGTKWLNIVQGPYAEWFGDWLRDAGAVVVDLNVPYDQVVDPQDVRKILAAEGDIECLAVVHCETPSGTLNPIGEVAMVAREFDVIVLADTVATFATSDLEIDSWGIDIGVVAPHKGLGSTPGISVVSVSEKAWKKMRNNKRPLRGSFLSLLDWKERWIDSAHTTFLHAPSISEVVALEVSLDELEGLEGIEASKKRHARAARAVREGIRATGLELWVKEDSAAANCTTTVRAPKGIVPLDVVRSIRDKQEVMLSIGRGQLESEIFCIGHMGISARSAYPVVGVTSLARGLKDFGVDLDLGAGADKAWEIMSEEL